MLFVIFDLNLKDYMKIALYTNKKLPCGCEHGNAYNKGV